MGVGQHLKHLLICITTDTLLDQENGARNNKAGGDSLEGDFEFPFPCLQHSHGAGDRRSAPQQGPGQGKCTAVAHPSPGWADTSFQLPTSLNPKHLSPDLSFFRAFPTLYSFRNPLPGTPLAAVMTPALPNWGVVSASVVSLCPAFPIRMGISQGQGPNLPCQSGTSSMDHSTWETGHTIEQKGLQ